MTMLGNMVIDIVYLQHRSKTMMKNTVQFHMYKLFDEYNFHLTRFFGPMHIAQHTYYYSYYFNSSKGALFVFFTMHKQINNNSNALIKSLSHKNTQTMHLAIHIITLFVHKFCYKIAYVFEMHLVIYGRAAVDMPRVMYGVRRLQAVQRTYTYNVCIVRYIVLCLVNAYYLVRLGGSLNNNNISCERFISIFIWTFCCCTRARHQQSIELVLVFTFQCFVVDVVEDEVHSDSDT